MALDYCQIPFLLNILEINRWNLTKFCIFIDVDQTRFGLLCVNLSKFATQLWLLVIVNISVPPNILPRKEITLRVKPVSR